MSFYIKIAGRNLFLICFPFFGINAFIAKEARRRLKMPVKALEKK
jgi:hypothetical protein